MHLGSCTCHCDCQAAGPKAIGVDTIARMNRFLLTLGWQS